MNRQERGQRNLEKLRKIATEYSGRVTFWNPTAEDKMISTIHFTDAQLVTKLHDMMSLEYQSKFVRMMATASGFLKVLEFAWSKATYKSEVTA
tara:strand:+ start:1163 stop:1441 length:279 start_codon:yes stop_codon:yes gene_type:complete